MSQQHDDETTRIETLLDQSTGDARPEPDQHGSGPVVEGAAPAPAKPYAAHPVQSALPEYKSGPAPTTSVVGLLGLLTVIAVLVTQATDLEIAWGVVGPVAVVGAGVLLVVLGLAGLRGQRFRG